MSTERGFTRCDISCFDMNAASLCVFISEASSFTWSKKSVSWGDNHLICLIQTAEA